MILAYAASPWEAKITVQRCLAGEILSKILDTTSQSRLVVLSAAAGRKSVQEYGVQLAKPTTTRLIVRGIGRGRHLRIAWEGQLRGSIWRFQFSLGRIRECIISLDVKLDTWGS